MTVRAFVLINPGNPTGQCLTEAELVQLAKFCIKHRLVLMSDEVYQSNVYADSSALPLSRPLVHIVVGRFFSVFFWRKLSSMYVT